MENFQSICYVPLWAVNQCATECLISLHYYEFLILSHTMYKKLLLSCTMGSEGARCILRLSN